MLTAALTQYGFLPSLFTVLNICKFNYLILELLLCLSHVSVLPKMQVSALDPFSLISYGCFRWSWMQNAFISKHQKPSGRHLK